MKYSLATTVTTLLVFIAVVAGLYFKLVLGFPNFNQALVVFPTILYSIYIINTFFSGKAIHIGGAIYGEDANKNLRRIVAALAGGLYLICIRFLVRGF